MNIIELPLTEIKPNPDNPRYISKDKFEKLKTSIKEFPEMLKIRPIVTRNGIALGGNMRLKALQDLGYKKAWVIKAEDLTEKQVREFIIKDNVGFGEWEWDQLANEWDAEELEQWGLDTPDKWGVEEAEVTDDDFDEALPEEPITILGDLIEIGEHRLLCGDSTDSDQVAKLMNGEKADMAHNDPPYGMKKENEGVLNDNLNFDDLIKFNKDWIPLQWSHLKENGSWYCWGIDEPLMDIYSEIIKPYQNDSKLTFRNLLTWDKKTGQGQNSEVHRMFATADEKCLFIMMGKQNMVQNKDQFPEEWRPLLNYFKEERDKMGWTTKDVVKITGKTSASHYFTESQFLMPTIEHYAKMQEAAGGKAFTRSFNTLDKKGFSNKSDGKSIIAEFYENRAYFNNTHDNMNNVWHFNRTTQTERQNTGGHATPKPLELCARAIKSSCPDNGLVLDMFLGSGSTMVASHQLKRKCYGMELDPKYCDVIIKRMIKLDPSLKIIRNGKPTEDYNTL